MSRVSLPPQPTRLIGRAEELAGIDGLLSGDARLVTLTGPAGAGKTRLAVAAAERLADAFPDGVLFVDLAPIVEPRLVVPTIGQALETGSEAVSAKLGEGRWLLLLDNFEQVVEAATDLAALLAACPRLKLLVTSRAALHLRWEHELPLAPLPLPDLRRLADPGRLAEQPAVALFVERARAIRPDFQLGKGNAAAVAEICVRLDGLPLAIELAAARVKVLPPAALLERLAHRLDALARGARDQPSRQQTLRAAIAWSYDLLAQDEQALFRRMSIFVGGTSLRAAGFVMGGDALDGLASLVDKNLLRQEETGAGEPRFAFFETIREFALERLAESGELAEVRDRHARCYASLARVSARAFATPGQAAALQRVEAEHDNLRAALRCLVERDQAGPAIELLGHLTSFWMVRGHLAEGRAVADRLVALPAVRADPFLLAEALHSAATLANYQRDYPAARRYQEECLAVRRALDDQIGVGIALSCLGTIASQQGNHAEARAFVEETVEIYQRMGQPLALGAALSNLAGLVHEQGDLAEARRLYEEALPHAGDRTDLLQQNLARVAQDQGDHDAARRLFELSLSAKRAQGDHWGAALVLGLLGGVALARGDHAAALARLSESLSAYRDLGDRAGAAVVLEHFAALSAATRQPIRAMRLAGAAAAMRRAVDAPAPAIVLVQLDAALAPARRAIGEATASVAHARGESLSFEEAVEYALTPEEVELLSAREREVALLVARGLTNRQVAEALVISERTVDGHVANVLGKLGLTSRSQVALWAANRYPEQVLPPVSN